MAALTPSRPLAEGADAFTVGTRFHRALGDGRIECTVCPRACRLREGQRGLCFVRARRGDEVVLTSYGRSSGFCVDPVEKKPLAHFLPGTPVLSFGTAGCNLACRFCQNWDISKSRETDTLTSEAEPETLATTAKRLGCKSIAFTYNDPTVFLEYAADCADAARDAGLKAVAVSAGYIRPEARRELYAHMDAANIDLKAFTEEFYRTIAFAASPPASRQSAGLRTVLDTLEYLVHETDVWTEITTLLIPGRNDSDAEIAAECAWIHEHLGPDVPLHFTAFHPDFKMRDVPPTPVATLRRARAIARDTGLRYVYTGNAHDPEGQTTTCADCGEALIVRDRYRIVRYAVSDNGHCSGCGAAVPGIFDGPPGDWGPKRQPIRLPDPSHKRAPAQGPPPAHRPEPSHRP
ncbi:AmmeMemoRadiSam system radical SAM enzyme [Glycomyces sp. TRM65418]|uniref:AmmeMemoRadiSam system radical SAM enzyme n=1 Tax=Glycomyces sp. TRM65418 TaxID=2867006 RepID=UPI001CE55BCA|nr:AmmeMemoRadiSam system radical SAM enzyme [Glycomyces sp. TRM65418]MCC3763544.1 AmmeMemoRadiSam system radical SAM enzyme [Glycomyces sp. TRM65418]QZD57527.1 AmmeMemoRadiSam system radical SAM enzyme [Glycomyces sp. TRM65418]